MAEDVALVAAPADAVADGAAMTASAAPTATDSADVAVAAGAHRIAGAGDVERDTEPVAVDTDGAWATNGAVPTIS